MRLLVRVQVQDMRSKSFIISFIGNIKHDVDEVETGKQSGRQIYILHH